jgi:3-oxoacyl-[acyl-carrier protein] reductase
MAIVEPKKFAVPELPLAGKVAIVTGGSRGIGRAIAIDLACNGADVALNYSRSAGEAEEAVREIQALNRRGLAVQANVASFADAQRMVDTVVSQLGRLDILVNNAGIAIPGPFLDSPPDAWDDVIAVNLRGTLLCAHAALPGMVRRGYGRIVNISSQFGLAGAARFAVYSAAKGAVIAFTKALAREVGPHGVTVNAVAPGPIVTDMNRTTYTAEEWRRRAARLPVGRVGDPEDVAHAVLYLASEEAGFTTGQVVMPNGGELM